jgi:hypothetical protein
MRQDSFETLYHWDRDKNSKAPILFRDFEYGAFTMNKSYLVKEEDIRAASTVKKPNSISIIDAVKLRWKICMPDDDEWDLQRCKKPLREFVREVGLELYLDMSEVVDVRIPLNKGNS